MKFKDWLIKEVGTSTGDIAGFARMTIPLVRRIWPNSAATFEFPEEKKKKIKMQPQVQE